MLERLPMANATQRPTLSGGSRSTLHRSRFRIRQPNIASLSKTPGRESSSWHCSGAMGCTVSLLATAPEHGHGANLPVLRRPTLGRVRRVRRGALRTPRRTRGEGHRRIHLRRHFRSRRDRRTAHGIGRQLPALDRHPTRLSSGLASLAAAHDIDRRLFAARARRALAISGHASVGCLS